MSKMHTVGFLFYGQIMYTELNGRITELSSQMNNGLTVNVIEFSDLKKKGDFPE